MRLYFARHGESEANVQGVFWNGAEGYGLTDKGRAQAEELARRLQDIPFAALYCSPVLRARQTAQILSRRLGVSYQVHDGLREYDVGILEGRPYDDEAWQLYWQAETRWAEHGDYEARIEGGESYNDMVARFVPLIEALEDRYGAGGANVLLIAHGGIYRQMLPRILDNIDVPYAQAQPITYATPIVAELRDGRWLCLRWGEEALLTP
jgi:probable phosphoglycerate mutase